MSTGSVFDGLNKQEFLQPELIGHYPSRQEHHAKVLGDGFPFQTKW